MSNKELEKYCDLLRSTILKTQDQLQGTENRLTETLENINRWLTLLSTELGVEYKRTVKDATYTPMSVTHELVKIKKQK